jgi:hypothetical protein
MRKTLRVLATLSILASSILFAQPASAVTIGPLYSIETGSGDVACTTAGWMIISNNVVVDDYYCNGTANIPSGVTNIGVSAFYQGQLSGVTIPNTVTRISDYAFAYSRALTSVAIPNSVTYIGEGAFIEANSLSSVTLPNGITTIFSRAFQGTFQNVSSNSTSITIPNSVTVIETNAFNGASNLHTVIIPDSVIDIQREAFANGLYRRTVVIGEGVTTLGRDAFANNPLLTSLVIGSNVSYMTQNAFNTSNSLTSYTYCGSLTEGELSNAGLGGKTNTCRVATVTAGEIPNSKIATFSSSGVKKAEFPASDALPAIKLDFALGGVVPPSVTVRPTTNPAPLSATPFMTTGSLKIVEIEVPAGHDGSDVKICLDGTSTDNLYHYTGGQWVELLGRTYENNQVCGITNSFSPFVAAPVSPLTVPGAPIIGTATATGTTTASVDFTAPASDGGTTILSYTATSTPGGITATVTQAGSGTISVTGLNPSTLYTFTVTALNAIGDSVASSASNSTSTVGVPSAPSSLVATSTGKRSALVKLINNASNGGSNITSYTFTVSPSGLAKTFTIGSPTNLEYEFLNLEPNTTYTFSATATNSIGTSVATTSNSIKTDALVPATLSNFTFTDDGTGTGGKLAWSGKYIEAVLYTGPAASYPGPFTFGAFSTSWNGTIRNLIPETDYTISIYAISVDGIGESKSLTFKTGSGVLSDAPIATAQTSSQLSQVVSWVNLNSFTPGEATNINSLLTKFDALVTSPHRSFVKVPTSRVSKVEVKSLTPNSCSVVSATAKVDAGLVKALTKDTCTISYTVSGPSKAPATLVKDFVFKKVS